MLQHNHSIFSYKTILIHQKKPFLSIEKSINFVMNLIHHQKKRRKKYYNKLRMKTIEKSIIIIMCEKEFFFYYKNETSNLMDILITCHR